MFILYCLVGKNEVTKQEVPPLSPLIWGERKEGKRKKRDGQEKEKTKYILAQKNIRIPFRDDNSIAFPG